MIDFEVIIPFTYRYKYLQRTNFSSAALFKNIKRQGNFFERNTSMEL